MACTLRFVGRDSEGVKNLLYITDTTSTGLVGYTITLNGSTIYSDGEDTPHAPGSTITLSAPVEDGIMVPGVYSVVQTVAGDTTYSMTFSMGYTPPSSGLSMVIDGYTPCVKCYDYGTYAGLTVSSYRLAHTQPTVGESAYILPEFTVAGDIYAGTHTLTSTVDTIWVGGSVTVEDRVSHTVSGTAYKPSELTILDAISTLKEAYAYNLTVNRTLARTQKALLDELDLYEDDYSTAIRRHDSISAYNAILAMYLLLNETPASEGLISPYAYTAASIEYIVSELARLATGRTPEATTHNYVAFNTSFTALPTEGRMQWNAEDGTLEVGLPGGKVTLQIGEEFLVRVRNEEASTITNGTAVYASSATGTVKKVKVAHNTSWDESSRVVGVATEDLSSNGFGYITLMGLVRGMNTAGFTAGQIVYMGSDGRPTGTKPTAPAATVEMGIVVYAHAEEGILFAKICVHPRVQDLSDVNGTPEANDMLQHNGTNFALTKSPIMEDPTIGGLLSSAVAGGEIPSLVYDWFVENYTIAPQSVKDWLIAALHQTYTNMGNIAANASGIDTMQGEIASLDGRVDSLEATPPSGLVLGETSMDAYRGDRGKIAYDHSRLTENPHGMTPYTAMHLVDGYTATQTVAVNSGVLTIDMETKRNAYAESAVSFTLTLENGIDGTCGTLLLNATSTITITIGTASDLHSETLTVKKVGVFNSLTSGFYNITWNVVSITGARYISINILKYT